MAAQANSAPPAGGAELNWFWRIGLVGGLTLIVVLVWALQESSPQTALVGQAAEVQSVVASSGAATERAAGQPAALEQRAAARAAAAPNALAAEQAGPVEWPRQSGIIPGRPDPPAPPSPSAFERYIVQRGETLFLIAALRGVALDDLLLFNPELGDGSVLRAGAAIWIPIWEATDNDDAP